MASGIPIWFDTIFGTSPSLKTTLGLPSLTWPIGGGVSDFGSSK